MRTINPIHIQGMRVETSLQQMPVEQSTKHLKERNDEISQQIHEENKRRKYGNRPVRTTYPHGSVVDIPLGKKSNREKHFRYY